MEEKTKTKAELIAEMKAAANSGNWKAVSKVSTEIGKMVAAEEKTEADKKTAVRDKMTEKVKAVIDKVLQPLIDAKELDDADGVWYVQDFGEALTSCRLVKTATRKAGTGGGAGRKFSNTTNELVAQYGDKMMGDSGKTFKEAYAEAGTDGNKRYAVRVKILAFAGLR